MDDKEALLSYEVKRVTDFGEYTAMVTVDEETRITCIDLYQGEPFIRELWGLLKIKLAPIKTTKIHPAADVNRTITRLIIDWELPFYQQQQAETSDNYLMIDHAEELKKRRARLQLEEEEKREFEMIVKDWEDEKVQALNRSKAIHPNSLANLKQYQNRKAK